MQKLPTPQYIVFYNGTENEADERVLRLSDAFMKAGGCLECEARMLNINYGHNRELMEKCRRLEEYSIFVARVRGHMEEKKMSLKKAITLSMEECIEENVLRDILTKQRDEVLGVILSTFNKELYEKNLKKHAFDEGYDKGSHELLKTQVQKKLSKGKSLEKIADELEVSQETVQNLIKEILES